MVPRRRHERALLEPPWRGGAEHLARHAGLVAALRERLVVVETAAAGDRAALRAANELGLRRVGRELRFLVR